MIEIKKLVVRTLNGIKEYSVQHTKDGEPQKFRIFTLEQLNDLSVDADLKEAITKFITP